MHSWMRQFRFQSLHGVTLVPKTIRYSCTGAQKTSRSVNHDFVSFLKALARRSICWCTKTPRTLNMMILGKINQLGFVLVYLLRAWHQLPWITILSHLWKTSPYIRGGPCWCSSSPTMLYHHAISFFLANQYSSFVESLHVLNHVHHIITKTHAHQSFEYVKKNSLCRPLMQWIRHYTKTYKLKLARLINKI